MPFFPGLLPFNIIRSALYNRKRQDRKSRAGEKDRVNMLNGGGSSACKNHIGMYRMQAA